MLRLLIFLSVNNVLEFLVRGDRNKEQRSDLFVDISGGQLGLVGVLDLTHQSICQRECCVRCM